MAFESGVVPEDWKSAVNVLLDKGKGARNECKKYRRISLDVFGWKKIYGDLSR